MLYIYSVIPIQQNQASSVPEHTSFTQRYKG